MTFRIRSMLTDSLLTIFFFVGLVGLAVSYALSITNLLSGVVTSFTETEKQMVSVERAGQYINDVPAEKQTSTLNVLIFFLKPCKNP